MKIFITGVAGVLGSHLADRMIEKGIEVVGVDNMFGGNIANVPKGVRVHRVDCGNRFSMLEAMEGCDTVFHAACEEYGQMSIFSPGFIVRNTVQSTTAVLSAAIENNVKKFYFCSSTTRYGRQKVFPFTEDMTCNPIVPLGVAKVAAEDIVKQMCKIYGIYHNIIIPGNIIGTRHRVDNPYRNVAAIMISRMLKEKCPIVYGDGGQSRCFTYIGDIVDGIEELIFGERYNGHTFNLCSSEGGVTINQLSDLINEVLGTWFQPIYLLGRSYEMRYGICSSKKAERLFNYSPKVTLKQGLEEMINYTKEKELGKFNYRFPIEINNDKMHYAWLEKLI